MKHIFVVVALTSALMAAGATRSAVPAASATDARGLVTSFGPIESHDRLFRGEVVEYTRLEQGSAARWVVRLETMTNRPVAGAEVVVRAYMPEDSGMVARTASARHVGSGRYEISGLEFDRAGWWNVGLIVRAGRHVDSLAFNLLLPGASTRRGSSPVAGR